MFSIESPPARSKAPVRTMRSAIAIVALNTFVAGSASTEVGYGYIQVSDVPGGARVEQYRNWVRIEGRYWGVASVARPNGTGGSTARPVFSIPTGPREGPGELIISVDKQSPALAPLMALCARQAGVAEMTFAESADDYRHTFLEIGDRPGTIPPFFEYRLKHVQFSACAVDAAAPEQAFVLKFGGIDWLNYDGRNPRIGEGTRRERPAEEIRLEPAKLIPAQFSGEVRTFVVNWLGLPMM